MDHCLLAVFPAAFFAYAHFFTIALVPWLFGPIFLFAATARVIQIMV